MYYQYYTQKQTQVYVVVTVFPLCAEERFSLCNQPKHLSMPVSSLLTDTLPIFGNNAQTKATYARLCC